MKYDWIASARFASWHLSKIYSLEEAQIRAKRLKSQGVNTVITFGYHYRFEHVDQWPEIQEGLKNIVTACHENGIRVVEHHSATFVPPQKLDFVVDGIPLTDCTVRDARDDKPAFFEEYQIIMLCVNNPKFKKIYFDYVLDLVKKTGVDALMSDDIEFCPDWYVCSCPNCREKFKKLTGRDLPKGDSPQWGDYEDPWFRDWLRFRMKSVGDYYVDLRKAMNEAGLNIPLLGCLAGASKLVLSQLWGMTGEEFARGVDLNFFEDYLGRESNFYNWRYTGAEIRYYHGIGHHFGQPQMNLYYTKTDDEMFFVWAFNLLMGDRIWLNSEINKPEENLLWEDAHKELFNSPDNIADIAVLFSKQTRDVLGGYSEEYYIEEWQGWAEILLEENIPYHVIIDSDLTEDLSHYKLLIIPGAACLSDKQITGIRTFISMGGRVIATGETSYRDETGELRKEPALADWFLKSPTNFKYYPEKVGSTQMFNPPVSPEEDNKKVEWEDKRDLQKRAELINQVKEMAVSLPWRVTQGGKGILVNVQSVKGPSQSFLVAHILNVSSLDLGDKATIGKECALKFQSDALPSSVTIELGINRPQSATLFSPDNPEPIQVPIEPVDDPDGPWEVYVKANQIKRYGVIRIDF